MQKPLNILTLASLFPNSAMPNFGIFVGRQTHGLAQRPNVRVTVINPIGLPVWPLSWHPHFAKLRRVPARDEWLGLTCYHPVFRTFPGQSARNPKAVYQAVMPLAKKLHEQQPFDLIDAEFFWPDAPAAMMLADTLNLPFTAKSRGADIHYWPKQKDCEPLIKAAGDKASGLLAVSAALKADMAELGMDAHKIRVHYTGIDQSLFKPLDRAQAKAQLGLSGPVMVSVGALIARKRQHLLIEALLHLPEMTLILIGQGEGRDAYAALAEKLGVSNRVRFTGPLPHSEIARYVGAADMAALVSESEGLANAWVEALSAGTPLIACDVGGVRELVRGPQAGHIVDANAHAIASAAQDLLTNPRQQDQVRAQIAHMSWDENARQLEAFFQKIAGK